MYKKSYGFLCIKKKLAKEIRQKTYGRREMVESVFEAIKRKFRANVNSLSAHTKRAEVYCRAIAHNIISFCLILFQRSSTYAKV
jgi:transposase